jgi:hypothetical protein
MAHNSAKRVLAEQLSDSASNNKLKGNLYVDVLHACCAALSDFVGTEP